MLSVLRVTSSLPSLEDPPVILGPCGSALHVSHEICTDKNERCRDVHTLHQTCTESSRGMRCESQGVSTRALFWPVPIERSVLVGGHFLVPIL